LEFSARPGTGAKRRYKPLGFKLDLISGLGNRQTEASAAPDEIAALLT
jgi:hypothetical protein